MKEMFKHLLLLIVASILLVVVGAIGIKYFIVKIIFWAFRFNGKATKKASSYFYDTALAIDKLGNVIIRDWLNDWCLKDSKIYPFGGEDQTVSHVLGVNKNNGNLRFVGKILVVVLDSIDPGHTDKSV